MDWKRFLSTMSLTSLIVVGIMVWSNNRSETQNSQAAPSDLAKNTVGQGMVSDEGNTSSENEAESGQSSLSNLETETSDKAVNSAEDESSDKKKSEAEDKSVFKLEIVESKDSEQVDLSLGSITDEKYKALIAFDASTASVTSVKINGHKYKVNEEGYGYPLLNTCKDVDGVIWHSFMLDKIKIDGIGKSFDLKRNCWKVLEISYDQISFIASILDGEDKYLDVIKTFKWETGNYEMDFSVKFVNHTNDVITIHRAGLSGPTGVLREDTRRDRRNVFAGYFESENQFEVEMANPDKVKKDGKKLIETKDNKYLHWFAYGNKFFTSIVRPLPKGEAQAATYISNQVILKTAKLNSCPDEKYIGELDDLRPYTEFVPGEVEASGDSEYDFKIYFGPVDKELFEEEPFSKNFYVATSRGGTCSTCTFTWLNAIIFKLMQFCYMVTHNYGISIIFLVFLVRLALHPITKKSQVNMHKMSKLGPKMEEIKKKFGDNQKELQRQMAVAYKEIGFNPLMGCLPMLLQMPIWIALYSSVDSNIGLRHEGLFPAGFPWLNDLSAPDRLIPFTFFGMESGVTLPLLGNVDAFNILPILLTIAMFFQSKSSMAQNQTATMSPEQAQQQKMMMYMMPGMMLLFFYTAPSGLNLYIMASTFAGLIEQKRIKKHLKEQEAAQNVGVVEVKSKALGKKMGEKQKKPKERFRR